MEIEIKVPPMGESVTEATVSAILLESGDFVAMDQEIVELETDKVNQVLYAPQEGQLTLNIAVDETVSIGQVIGYVDTSKKGEVKKAQAATDKPSAPKAPPTKEGEHQARKQLKEFVEDIQKPQVSKTGTQEREVERKPLSKIRKVIAKRLVEAKNNTAMLTTFNEVDLTDIMAYRKEVQERFVAKHGVKLGFMSLFTKAVVKALQEVPQINAYIEGEDMLLLKYYDIGIAVGTDRGLVVPVIRDCDALSYAQIESHLKDYAQKARLGGLSMDDLKGGGFTITNGGVYGSLISTPILNIPQSAILGMHAIQKRPVVKDEEIVIRDMMYLALSYDHRLVDGKEAVTFLVTIKEFLEDLSHIDLGI